MRLNPRYGSGLMAVSLNLPVRTPRPVFDSLANFCSSALLPDVARLNDEVPEEKKR